MKSNTNSALSHEPPRPRAHRANDAFTLLELLAIIGTVVLLALMLVPALANTKPHHQAAQCQNNLRQLTRGWLMYPADNLDTLMPNPGWAGDTIMDWTANPGNTNASALTDPSQSIMAGYVKSAALFKCPADTYQSPANVGPRVRSIALNGVVGNPSGPTVWGTSPGGRIYYGRDLGTGTGATKMSHLNKPGPAQVCLILDEHPDSINDATYMFDVGYPRGSEKWRDLPGSFHNGAGSLSYADGHAEIHHWQDSRTLVSPAFTSDFPWKNLNLLVSADYEWLQDRMPYREE